MEAVFGLLVLLTGVSCGVETYCDARMDKAQCYGALGGAVNIQLITQTTQDKRYKWYRNNTQILNVRNNVATITDKSLQNRTSFTVSNGTFRMSNIKTTDDAEYVFYIFNETGAEVKRHKLQMSVQGFIYINCTLSNGTYVFERVPGANNTLCIKPTITMPESEATTMVYIAVSLSAVVILLVVVVGVYCAQMKKKTSKAQDIGDEQDITYDDVRFLKRQGRQKEKREETEVEYGQVKVSGGGRQTVETVDNDCMYAKVKHHQ
ncbi:uncharacterized protein ACJ7VT_006353 isoform 3-T3 [Polymixia lowei]